MCKARRYSDQMQCGRCGYVWDVNDPDPPKCKTPQEYGKEQIEKIRKQLEEGRN